MSTDALDVLDQMMMGPQSPGSHDLLSKFLEWGDRYATAPSIYWKGLHRCWTDCDDTWDIRDDFLELCRFQQSEMSDGLPCDFLENSSDKSFYDALPNKIVVYRGCSMDRVMGVARTTDKSVALGFARGHRGISVPDPVLASAFAWKGAILGAYQERQESEIVVDPCFLTNIRVRHLMRARDWT